MNRSLSFLLLAWLVFLCGLSTRAQTPTYILVSKTGECAVKTEDAWPPLTVGAHLTEQTVLRNSGYPKAELQIIETTSGKTYRMELLHREFPFSSFMAHPDDSTQNGAAQSYVRFLKESVAHGGKGDVHFVRTRTGISNRGSGEISLDQEELDRQGMIADRIVFSLSTGKQLFLEDLTSRPSDYPVSCTLLQDGYLFENNADQDLFFILFQYQKTDNGLEWTSVFSKKDKEKDEEIDDALLVPALSQRFYPEHPNEKADYILIAYPEAVHPVTLWSTLHIMEGAFPPQTELVKVGICTVSH